MRSTAPGIQRFLCRTTPSRARVRPTDILYYYVYMRCYIYYCYFRYDNANVACVLPKRTLFTTHDLTRAVYTDWPMCLQRPKIVFIKRPLMRFYIILFFFLVTAIFRIVGSKIASDYTYIIILCYNENIKTICGEENSHSI